MTVDKPFLVASKAKDIPPDPPPITATSYYKVSLLSCSLFGLKLEIALFGFFAYPNQKACVSAFPSLNIPDNKKLPFFLIVWMIIVKM
jgi:hypothetical protein